MRQPENCNIKYFGYESPRTTEELNFEILGLKNLIKKAKQRISELEQTKFLVEEAIKNKSENLEDFFNKDKKWNIL